MEPFETTGLDHRVRVLTPMSPFKCPTCRSPYFGAIFEGGLHVGRYCKGWPSGYDRSYTPCRGKHEERFERPNVEISGHQMPARKEEI